MDYQCTAIVLRTYRLNESDKILHLYSREHGPVQCIAKGAYRVNSKFAAKAQVLNCLDLLLAGGRNLDIVKEARLVQAFPHINSNYEALTLACFAIEVLAQVAINDDNYETLFNLICTYLNELENMGKKANNELVFSSTCKYLWQLICILGYKPDLDTCSLTNTRRNTKQIPQYFDMENGGVTSSKAYRELVRKNPYQDSIRELKPGVFNTLLNLEQNLDPIEHSRFGIEHTLKFLHKHLEYRIHKEFKSWKLVEQILNPSLSVQAA